MATARADRLLPTGPVTFLFSDIEGSTHLRETQRALARTGITRPTSRVREA